MIPIINGINILLLPFQPSILFTKIFSCEEVTVVATLEPCGISFLGNDLSSGEWTANIDNKLYTFTKIGDCVISNL